MSRGMIKYLVAGIVLLALSSCLPVFSTIEIQPVSLKVIQRKDLVFIDQNYADEGEIRILEITITANTNLPVFAEKNSLTFIYSDLFSCSNKTEFIDTSNLLANNKPAMPAKAHLFINEVPPYHYQNYLALHDRWKNDPPERKYNFWKKQEDVCMWVRAFDPYSFGIKSVTSNTIRIPKEAIKAALDDYRKAHPDFVPPKEP